MTQHESFSQQKQPAAVLKHAVLSEYTRVFASAVGPPPVWVIDGHAGAGAHESDNPEASHPRGSPLVMLKTARSLAKTQTINSIFIERNPAIASALEVNTAHFRAHGLGVTVLKGDVEDRLPQAWRLVGNDPVVTFLDPFGVAMSRAMMTNQLLARPQGARPSEVLLSINVEAVRRIGGNFTEDVQGKVMPRAGRGFYMPPT